MRFYREPAVAKSAVVHPKDQLKLCLDGRREVSAFVI